MELMPVVNIDCASTAKKEDKNRKGKITAWVCRRTLNDFA